MNQFTPASGRWAIIASFVVAFILTVVPLPDWFKALRPEWVMLILIFWCLVLPHRIGVGAALGLGLLLDVLKGGILGQHGLALAVVAFLLLKVHQRIHVYPAWQQALSIGALIFVGETLMLLVSGIVGTSRNIGSYWLPSLTSALLWPWLYIIMRDVKRHFHVQ